MSYFGDDTFKQDLLDKIKNLEERIGHLREEIIDLWHLSTSEKSLHEHLGMTFKEYGRLILSPNNTKKENYD